MAENTIQADAETSLAQALSKGQSRSQGDMSNTKVDAAAAYDIATRERERLNRVAGRRPLFRGINLGVM